MSKLQIAGRFHIPGVPENQATAVNGGTFDMGGGKTGGHFSINTGGHGGEVFSADVDALVVEDGVATVTTKTGYCVVFPSPKSVKAHAVITAEAPNLVGFQILEDGTDKVLFGTPDGSELPLEFGEVTVVVVA